MVRLGGGLSYRTEAYRGTRSGRLASGARLEAEQLTLFLDDLERDLSPTVVEGGAAVSSQGETRLI
jgi:hypothetical protein